MTTKLSRTKIMQLEATAERRKFLRVRAAARHSARAVRRKIVADAISPSWWETGQALARLVRFSNREAADVPVIGQPLTVKEARRSRRASTYNAPKAST
jgi:hypothetical protein